MRFNCDYFRDKAVQQFVEREKREWEWNDWFAWRPIKVAHGDCRWWETIERRREPFERVRDFGGYGYTYTSWEWVYRAKQ